MISVDAPVVVYRPLFRIKNEAAEFDVGAPVGHDMVFAGEVESCRGSEEAGSGQRARVVLRFPSVRYGVMVYPSWRKGAETGSGLDNLHAGAVPRH